LIFEGEFFVLAVPVAAPGWRRCLVYLLFVSNTGHCGRSMIPGEYLC
jgi:hypothetical protein